MLQPPPGEASEAGAGPAAAAPATDEHRRSLRRAAILTATMGIAFSVLFVFSFLLITSVPNARASDDQIREFYTGGGSPAIMLTALKDAKIDVLITWQPAIGAFLKAYPDLEVVTIPNTRVLGAPEQYSFPMSMGVREGNDALKKRLDDVIEKHQAELTSILMESGVMVSFK